MLYLLHLLWLTLREDVLLHYAALVLHTYSIYTTDLNLSDVHRQMSSNILESVSPLSDLPKWLWRTVSGCSVSSCAP